MQSTVQTYQQTDVLFWATVAVIILPLLSFLLLFRSTFLDKKAGYISSAFLFINLLISFYILSEIWPSKVAVYHFEWFSLGERKFSVGFLLDNLSAMMLVLVNLVSLLVHLYSIEYMHEDKHQFRYFGYLGLFTFSMLGIITTNSLLVMFMFWELVGLSSYLLIGFWFQRKAAANASMKAFLLNRVGDLGFLIGIMSVWAHFHTLDFQQIYQMVGDITGSQEAWGLSWDNSWLLFTGLGLFCGCVGKSAQFPLQVWLPDAMQGPTPASALIHAATMVAAGVFLLARIFPLLIPEVLLVIGLVGAVTAFLGAFAATSQFDIKKVLAYSTVSQLGYMVMAMGTANYSGSVFHLFTHAFFKAALFLCVGAVIHSMEYLAHHTKAHFDPQDIRKMGGLRKYMPVTFYCYLFATLSAVGIPLFSGFLSKDMILSGTWAWADTYTDKFGIWIYIIPILGFSTVLLTAYYMGRQLFAVFFGDFRLTKDEEIISKLHDATPWMKVSMIVLAALSFYAAFSLNPFNASHSWFVTNIGIPATEAPSVMLVIPFAAIFEAMHHNHLITSIISVALAGGGLFYAYLKFHKANIIEEFENIGHDSALMRVAQKAFYIDNFYKNTLLPVLLKFTVNTNKFENRFVDGVINVFGASVTTFAHIINWFDRNFVDGFVHLQVFISAVVGNFARSFQAGKIQRYVMFAMASVLVVIVWFAI